MGEPWSLRARLLAVSLGVLLAFVVLTGAALDRAFRDSADAAQQERLEALLYLLMGALELDRDGTPVMPPMLPEARLATPASGHYAEIVRGPIAAAESSGPEPGGAGASAESDSRELDGSGSVRWVSNSALGLDVPFAAPLAPGEVSAEVRRGPDGARWRVVGRGVLWAIGPDPAPVSFSVAAPLASTGTGVEAYRRSLWSALALMAALLLAALVVVQRWGLRPLRVLARRIAAMEAGEARDLGGPYPRELAPLARNLDRLLARERAMLERHRKALGDLAHALKTPLAVLRAVAPDDALAATVREQTRRMDEIVQYQLQRAATAGAAQSAPPLVLAPLVGRLCASLQKVHGARGLRLENRVPEGLRACIDEGDAMELLGNLIDNACKWAAAAVRVRAAAREGGLLLTVEDDGPGIAEPERLVGRGVRGDEQVPGHGIGLAIVRDIALAYGGELRIGRSELGGACVEVWLCG